MTLLSRVKIRYDGTSCRIGDPVFWFYSYAQSLDHSVASLALTGNILGSILFFVLWNLIRMSFLGIHKRLDKAGSEIT